MHSFVLAAALLLGLVAVPCQSQKVGYCHCSKNSATNVYTLTTTVYRKGDTIADFYAVDKNKAKMTCTITNPTTTNDITATHNIDASSSAVVYTNQCGVEKVAGTTATYRWRYRTHKFANRNDVEDVVYVCTCNFANSVDTYLKASIQVDDTISETNAVTNDDTMVLEAINTNGVKITTATIGQMIALRVRYKLHSNYQDGISYPYGAYVFNVKASGTSDFQSAYTDTIIMSNGCPSTEDLAPAAQFERKSSITSEFVTTSGNIEVHTFTGKPGVLYFAAETGFCFGTQSTGSDQRCQDYCVYSAGRKKREVERTGKTLNLTLTIEMPGNNSERRGTTMDSAMYVLIPVLGILFIAVIIGMCCVLMAMKRRRDGNEKEGRSLPPPPPSYTENHDVQKA